MNPRIKTIRSLQVTKFLSILPARKQDIVVWTTYLIL